MLAVTKRMIILSIMFFVVFNSWFDLFGWSFIWEAGRLKEEEKKTYNWLAA